MDRRKLEDISIEITHDCPLKCIHCSSFNGCNGDRSFLNTQRILDIAKESIPLGLESISLSGGEPCTHPDLVNLVRRLKKLGLTITIYSCGATTSNRSRAKPLRDDLLRDLREAGLDRIVYNLQSSLEGVHEKISMTRYSFLSVIKSIESSINLKIDTELHIVPLKQNLSTIPLAIDLAKNLGLLKVSLLRFVPQGRGAVDYKEKMLDHLEYQELNKMVKSSNDFLRLGAPFNFLDHSHKTPCTAGLDKLVVRANGLVYACEAFKQSTMNLGNVNDSTLTDIWFGNRISSFRSDLKTRFSCIHDCDLVDNCYGQEVTMRSISRKIVRSNVEQRKANVV